MAIITNPITLLLSMLLCSALVLAAPSNGGALRYKLEHNKTPNGITYNTHAVDCKGVNAKCLKKSYKINNNDLRYFTVNKTQAYCDAKYTTAKGKTAYTGNCYSEIPTTYLIECTAKGQQDSWIAVYFDKTSVNFVAYGKASARISHGNTFRQYSKQDELNNVGQATVDVYCPPAGK